MKKEKSIQAKTAQAIRQELKKAFPQTQFKVTSDSFAGGDSVDVRWTNGPSEAQIQRLIGKYQYGHFDGMQDLYENTNRRHDIPQVKYVQWSREISEDIMNEVFQRLKKNHVGWDTLQNINQSCLDFKNKWGCWTASQYIWRKLSAQDLTKGYSI